MTVSLAEELRQSLIFDTNRPSGLSELSDLQSDGHLAGMLIGLALTSPYEDERAYAMDILKSVDSIPVVSTLNLFRDSLEETPNRLKALSETEVIAIVEAIIVGLRFDDCRERFSAILKAINDPRAVGPLAAELKALAQDDAEELIAYPHGVDVVQAVCRFHDKRALEALVTVVAQDEIEDIILGIKKYGAQAVEPLLQEIRRHPDPDTYRYFAITEAIASIGDVAIPVLIDALEDQKQDDRSTDPETLWFVERAIADALGSIGSTSAIPSLLSLMRKYDSPDGPAAMAITCIGDSRGIRPLLESTPCQPTDWWWVDFKHAVSQFIIKNGVEPLLCALRDMKKEGTLSKGIDHLLTGTEAEIETKRQRNISSIFSILEQIIDRENQTRSLAEFAASDSDLAEIAGLILES